MKPGQLKRAGEALYGSHWQTDLAHALGVSSRAVRHWIAVFDPRPIPSEVVPEVRRLLRDQAALLEEIAADL